MSALRFRFKSTNTSRKKSFTPCIICAVVVAIVIGIIIKVFIGSPIAGNWYLIGDDDCWLKISGNTISFCDVYNDEIYGTIEYKIKDGKIYTGDVTSNSEAENYSSQWSYDSLKELAEELDGQEYELKDGELQLLPQLTSDLRFSSDKSYKGKIIISEN